MKKNPTWDLDCTTFDKKTLNPEVDFIRLILRNRKINKIQQPKPHIMTPEYEGT